MPALNNWKTLSAVSILLLSLDIQRRTSSVPPLSIINHNDMQTPAPKTHRQHTVYQPLWKVCESGLTSHSHNACAPHNSAAAAWGARDTQAPKKEKLEKKIGKNNKTTDQEEKDRERWRGAPTVGLRLVGAGMWRRFLVKLTNAALESFWWQLLAFFCKSS